MLEGCAVTHCCDAERTHRASPNVPPSIRIHGVHFTFCTFRIYISVLISSRACAFASALDILTTPLLAASRSICEAKFAFSRSLCAARDNLVSPSLVLQYRSSSLSVAAWNRTGVHDERRMRSMLAETINPAETIMYELALVVTTASAERFRWQQGTGRLSWLLQR